MIAQATLPLLRSNREKVDDVPALHVDNATYAEWVRQAATHGLSVEAWLKFALLEHASRSGQGESASKDLNGFDPAVQLARLKSLEAKPQGYGGAELRRDELYD